MVQWLTQKDPGLLACRRSVRAAVVLPLVFGLTHLLTADVQVSIFGAFGSFALLLLVDFPGRTRTRVRSYFLLFVIGSCFIAVGTVVSTHKVAAVAVMALVGFGVLFAGVFSPQAASAATASLLLFVLPVAVAQPTGEVGPRLAGWALAGLFSIPACLVVWPTPWHDELRRRLSATVTALGRLATAHARGSFGLEPVADVQTELTLLRQQFRNTPYPSATTASATVALAKLTGRVEWVAGNEALIGDLDQSLGRAEVRAIIEAVAETLERSGSLICDGQAHPVDNPTVVTAVQEAAGRLSQLIARELECEVSSLFAPDHPTAEPADALAGEPGIATALDPSFHARALGTATEMLADAALEASGTQEVGDRRLGPKTLRPENPILTRLRSHLSLRSVWFRNAVRGATGLALAVAIVEITAVEHGFWVVLGTLSVLRTNALGTGATALRAVGGTAIGFVVGSAIMLGVSSHTVLLWALLPLAVLISGVAPSMISFAAGQAGFTVVVIILFNIIAPVGWRVGLTRVEDVAIGCAVSVAVGLLFWPRGATAALGRALADAFVASSGYLADAVGRLTTPHQVDLVPGQEASHRAYLRLDEAFRQFLTERGAKVVPVETVAKLLTGSNRLRLGAYTLSTLPAPPNDSDPVEIESVAIAGALLRDSYANIHRWYEQFAELLEDRRPTLDPPPEHEELLHHALRAAFRDARSARRDDRLRMALQMLWADQLLESQRQVQFDLAGSADLFARQSHRRQFI
jgi:uncharacterized membrane protein YccC